MNCAKPMRIDRAFGKSTGYQPSAFRAIITLFKAKIDVMLIITVIPDTTPSLVMDGRVHIKVHEHIGDGVEQISLNRPRRELLGSPMVDADHCNRIVET